MTIFCPLFHTLLLTDKHSFKPDLRKALNVFSLNLKIFNISNQKNCNTFAQNLRKSIFINFFMMKKIVFILMAAWLISCGDVYKEETGSVFEGTWSLVESYDYSDGSRKRVTQNVGKFITSRNIGNESFLLFYSGGTYDSSFFYRLQDSVIFVRKIMDSVDVILAPKIKTDEEGSPVDENGYLIEPDADGKIKYDRLVQDKDENGKLLWIWGKRPQKPLDPKAEFTAEKYYGAFSFRTGANLTMRIRRYAPSPQGNRGALLYEDVYERPLED